MADVLAEVRQLKGLVQALVDRSTWSIELPPAVIALRLGISMSTLRRRVAAGVYLIDPISTHAWRIDVANFTPALQAALSMPAA